MYPAYCHRVFGLIGLSAGLAMIGAKSLLDTWWKLSGIFAGGMLGLFLLGLISRQAKNAAAITATIIGVLVILWMTFSRQHQQRIQFCKKQLAQQYDNCGGNVDDFFGWDCSCKSEGS